MNITNLTGHSRYERTVRSAPIERKTLQEIKDAEKEQARKAENARRTTDVSEIKINTRAPFDRFVEEITELGKRQGALDIWDNNEYISMREQYMVDQGIAPDRKAIKQLLNPLVKGIEEMFERMKYSSRGDDDEDPMDFFEMVIKYVFDDKKDDIQQSMNFQDISVTPSVSFPVQIDIGDLHLSVFYGGFTKAYDKNGENIFTYSPGSVGWSPDQTEAEHRFMDIADAIYGDARSAGYREASEKAAAPTLNITV